MTLPLDIDSETIQLDGTWLTRDELSRKIKAMIDSGDFSVARQGAALEQLGLTLASVREVSFRARPQMAEALNTAASREGKTIGRIIRDALEAYLELPPLEVTPQVGTSGPPVRAAEVEFPAPPAITRRQTPPSVAAYVAAAAPVQAAPPDLKPIPLAASLPVVGDVPSVVVELGDESRSQKDDDPAAIEQRWFGS